MVDYKGKWALITGASSGIGEAFAQELAQKGANLVLVARRKDRLMTLANELSQKYSIKTDVISFDLAQVQAPYELFDAVEKRGYPIHILVNNAGVGVYGDLHKTDVKKNEQLIILNVFAPAIISQLFLSRMVKEKYGVIINVASTAAFVPTPYMSNYGASKAYLLSFTEALWAEHQNDGIRVLAVCPGPVETEFFEVMGNKMTSLGKRDTPETVAKGALQALDKNKSYIIPGMIKNYLFAQMGRLSTRKFVAKAGEKFLRPTSEK
jgi:uncharacterized protein